MQHKRIKGDKRPDAMLMAACIKDFNAKQTTKNRTSSDERDAILNLLQQTDQFRQTLGTHWQNFPVPHSAVPVSLMSKPWHQDSYEPPVKRATHPLTHEALCSSKAKRTAWLDRVIGKYTKALKDLRATGKNPNVKSMGAILRKEPDDEMVRHAACLFTAWLPQFQTVVTGPALVQLVDRFNRGTLDRELIEKVRSQDENLAVHDWRFLTALSDYRPPAHDGTHLQDAQRAKLDSDFKLDMVILSNEARSWSNYLSALRLFNADTHNDRVEEQEAVSSSLP